MREGGREGGREGEGGRERGCREEGMEWKGGREGGRGSMGNQINSVTRLTSSTRIVNMSDSLDLSIRIA